MHLIYNPRFAQPTVQLTRVSTPFSSIRKLLKNVFVRCLVLGLWLLAMITFQVLGHQPKKEQPRESAQATRSAAALRQARVERATAQLPKTYDVMATAAPLFSAAPAQISTRQHEPGGQLASKESSGNTPREATTKLQRVP
jgi:hypothetical protein